VLLGVTTRGICWLSFVSGRRGDQLDKMKEYWYNSLFDEDAILTKHYIARIFPFNGQELDETSYSFHLVGHRVIKSNRTVGGYQWGSAQKKGIFGLELSKAS